MARAIPTIPRKSASQKRSRVTVETLLDATARVLTKAGYDRASTNRIAATAGVSVGSLYQYFPNKEALVAALVARPGNSNARTGKGDGRRPSGRSRLASHFRRTGSAHGPARQDRIPPAGNLPADQDLPGRTPQRNLGRGPRFRDVHLRDHRRIPDP